MSALPANPCAPNTRTVRRDAISTLQQMQECRMHTCGCARPAMWPAGHPYPDDLMN